MTEKFPAPHSDDISDSEPLNLSGAHQIVQELLERIEAKALVERLAFKALVEQMSAASGPATAFRIQAHLDALRWNSELLDCKNNALGAAVAHELSRIIEMLDDLAQSA
jgi:hypothetical protein